MLKLAALLFLLAPLLASAAGPIRFLLPPLRFSLDFEVEINSLIEQYNKRHPETPVQLIRRGDDYSSLKELMALGLAGDPPDVATIEPSEFPALESAKILVARKGAKPSAVHLAETVPILIVNQEILFRARMNPESIPKTWPDLRSFALKISKVLEDDQTALAVSLRGLHGLWILESVLNGKPLWKKDGKTLHANTALEADLASLQEFFIEPRQARSFGSYEQGVDYFVSGKAAMMIGTLDLLPYLSKQASFRWAVARLPSVSGGPSELLSGMHLVVCQDRKDVWDFIAFLQANQGRLLKAGGFIRGSQLSWANVLKPAARGAGPEAIRARTEWVQTLSNLFGDPSKKVLPKPALEQLEQRLSATP